MDKLEARVRVFECLCNNQFNNFCIVTNEQLDKLVDKVIEIEQKLSTNLNKGE